MFQIAIDQDGNYLFPDSELHRVQIFTPTGQLLDSFGSKGDDVGELDVPHGITVDSKGNIYVSEERNHRIQV